MTPSSGEGPTSSEERDRLRDLAAAYHDTQLRDLIAHLERAFVDFGAGRIDAFESDEVARRYHRASKRLWIYCSVSEPNLERLGRRLERTDPDELPDWWQEAATRKRREP